MAAIRPAGPTGDVGVLRVANESDPHPPDSGWPGPSVRWPWPAVGSFFRLVRAGVPIPTLKQ